MATLASRRLSFVEYGSRSVGTARRDVSDGNFSVAIATPNREASWQAQQSPIIRTADPAPRAPRALSSERPRCRLCRNVRHHYAESADGLLRVCLGCAAGLPLALLTAADAAAELIAQRRPVHRRDFVQRLRARFPELAWDTGIIREGRQRRHVRQTASDTIGGAVANTPNHAG